MKTPIFLLSKTFSDKTFLQSLRSRLQLPESDTQTLLTSSELSYGLSYYDHVLTLETFPKIAHGPKPFFVDFTEPTFLFRIKRGRADKDTLVKAIGHQPCTVLDLMAGWGQDGFVLANAGHTVTMVEKNPVVHSLLLDGLLRAEKSPILQNACRRIKLIGSDGEAVLDEKTRYDAIYLDPMFEDSARKAKSSKSMTLLQNIVGAAEVSELSKLLKKATTRSDRVVLKRSSRAQDIGLEPSHIVSGSNIEFEVFLTTSP